MTDAAARPRSVALLRTSAVGLLASGVPAVAAALALPILTRSYGQDRLGMLTLAWSWVAYVSLLDMGIGRALTRLEAGQSAHGMPVAQLAAVAHRILVPASALLGLIVGAVVPWYVTHALAVPEALRGDAIAAGLLMAASTPVITAAAVPRSLLEARQQFTAVYRARLLAGLATFITPVLLLPFTHALSATAAVLLVARVGAWWLLHRALPAEDAAARPDWSLAPLLWREGAWATVSTVLSPLLVVADRFLIGALVSVSAVATYAVPWEASTKLWLLPAAIAIVLFPITARAAAGSAGTSLGLLHTAAMRLTLALVVPIAALAIAFADPLLLVFAGAEYVGDGTRVLQLLALGVVANSIGMISSTILQAAGRARTVALLHLGEILPFLLALVLATRMGGVVGAALVWSARGVVDAVLLAGLAHAMAPLDRRLLWQVTALMLVLTVVTTAALLGWPARVTGVAVATATLGAIALWLAHGPQEALVFRRGAR